MIVLICLLAGCGGSSGTAASGRQLMDAGDDGQGRPSHSQGHPSHSQESPSYDDLESLLLAELARLGKDPSSTASSAPTGDENVVFDLAAEVTDPDGEGGNSPTAITLTWTEQLCGDYNQDGLVTANDLTPLGQNWTFEIKYDDPALHGGFKYWPEGDPDDGDTGAANWRLARVNGNRNKLIEMADISPIGVHWQERLSGYRVYRKGPADLGFRFLVGSGDAQLSAGRPAADNTAPVRYAFSDDNEGGGSLPEGIYAYYIAPYDTASGKEGPASAVYVVSTTGVEPQAPVAKLTVSPEFAGAPAEITLDASASYDTDGTIAAFQWDFDGDGVVDWTSTDAVPETSSTGTVDTITPGADGIVTVSYNQGSADWYFPSVVAEDDLGLMSLPAFAQLGISGWIGEVVGDEHGTADVMIDMIAISEDPWTGEALAFGKSEGGTEYLVHPWIDILPAGFYVARRHGPGDWEHELVALEDTAAWHNYYEKYEWVNLDWAEFFWQDNGEPAVVMHTYPTSPNFDGRLYVALRQTGGTWETSCIYEGQLPLNYSKRGIYNLDFELTGPEQFVILMNEYIEVSSSSNTKHYYVLTYDKGSVSIEDTGAQYTSPTPDVTHWMLADIAVDSNGDMVCLLDKSFQIYPNELWILRRLGPDNWVDERIDSGNLVPADGTFMFRYCFYDENDRLLVLAYVGDFAGEVRTADYRLYSWNGSQVAVENTCDVTDMEGCLYKLGEDGSCAYFSMDPGNPLQYVKFEGTNLSIENLPTESSYFVCHGAANFYHAYAEVEYDTYPGPGIEFANEFVMRVDPRE